MLHDVGVKAGVLKASLAANFAKCLSHHLAGGLDRRLLRDARWDRNKRQLLGQGKQEDMVLNIVQLLDSLFSKARGDKTLESVAGLAKAEPPVPVSILKLLAVCQPGPELSLNVALGDGAKGLPSVGQWVRVAHRETYALADDVLALDRVRVGGEAIDGGSRTVEEGLVSPHPLRGGHVWAGHGAVGESLVKLVEIVLDEVKDLGATKKAETKPPEADAGSTRDEDADEKIKVSATGGLSQDGASAGKPGTDEVALDIRRPENAPEDGPNCLWVHADRHVEPKVDVASPCNADGGCVQRILLARAERRGRKDGLKLGSAVKGNSHCRVEASHKR